MAAVALTSCSIENEVITPDEEITFKNFTLSSKAILTNFPTDGSETFGVYATDDGGEFVGAADDEVSYKDLGSYWGWTEAKKWSEVDGNMTVYPYYPANADITLSEGALDITGADLGENAGSQVDYMIGEPTTGWNKTDHTGTTIPVVFSHITSMIDINIIDNTSIDEWKNKITVTKVSVNGCHTEGNYKGSTKKWTTTDDAGSFAHWTSTTLVSGTNTAMADFLIVPVELTDDQTLEITYDIAAYASRDAVIGATQTYKFKDLKDSYSNDITKFEAGKKYVYNIVFNLDDTDDEIKFNPSISNWDEVNVGISINIE